MVGGSLVDAQFCGTYRARAHLGAHQRCGGGYHLIGTVGNRAVIYKPDGSTAIVGLDEDIDTVGDKAVKLTNVSSKSAEIFYDGKKRSLVLETVSALTQKAQVSRQETERSTKQKKKSSSKTSEEAKDTNIVPLPMEKK